MVVTGPAYSCKLPAPVTAMVSVSVDVPVAGSPPAVRTFLDCRIAHLASVAVRNALSMAPRVRHALNKRMILMVPGLCENGGVIPAQVALLNPALTTAPTDKPSA